MYHSPAHAFVSDAAVDARRVGAYVYRLIVVRIAYAMMDMKARQGE